MRKITFKQFALILSCLLFITTTSKAQQMLYKISLQEQIASSSQIIEGEVIAKESFWDAKNKNIYTVNTVKVYKVFKGQVFNKIEVVTQGGTVGLQAQTVTPSLQLTVGEKGLFTLNNSAITFLESDTQKFRVYSGLQGFYKYNLKRDVVANPFYSTTGIATKFYQEIITLTKTEYASINPFVNTERLSNTERRVAVVINNFSPSSISAGTNSVLTINGSGFTNTQGIVEFRDADAGGEDVNGNPVYYSALDSQIVSWTDTQIQVEVPSRAGTGDFRVDPLNGETPAVSSLDVDVSFSEIAAIFNPGSGNQAYQTQHINSNGSGGYTWQMFTDFDANTPAKEAFLRAFDTWRCETGIHWTIGDVTTVDEAAADGVNVVRFDNGGELIEGVLGVCTTSLNGCSVSGEIQWFANELDIVFNDVFTGGLTGLNWQYGPALPSFNEVDFESVAVHELGHGHQLGHVINNNQIMHYALSNGDHIRNLSVNDIAGAGDVQTRSTTTTACLLASMTNFDCTTLTTEDFELSQEVLVYPNPVQEILFIKNTTNTKIDLIAIYDVNGKLVLKQENTTSELVTAINVNGFSQGVYFVKIKSANASFTKRVLVK